MKFTKFASAAALGAATLLTVAVPTAIATPSSSASEVRGTHRVDGYRNYGSCDNARINYLHAGYKVSLRCYPGHAWYFEWYTF
ncbi:hypothetical protein Lesp02_28640 [Lentzea sp. NBRC 105346]|uniref:hypothetical protein n=1 Tax=Lentzea sp. NBRC 105346 TaxID=3032205 RepID=UPI0025565529|nr:hypothetical protein [Lentzea sp. NBRC 105346]GLZ30675.1 hypothetical protein Lesp02_28640 [Lentzea sp. NBRC 105346]